MTDTYAINCTRGKEFEVRGDLESLGLHPWVPMALASRYVKERREQVWYDRPYLHKLLFCVIPAIYYRDVIDIKHVIGRPVELSSRDIEGSPAYVSPGGREIAAVPGLKTFRAAVEAEYADAERVRANSEYQCGYAPGQALSLLSGALQGLPAVFRDVVKQAHHDYAKLRVEVEAFGAVVTVEVDPDKVSAAG